LFLEEYTAEGAVSSIVEQTTSSDMPNGVQTLTLYTMELPPKDSSDDYISLMQKNLDNLKIGLGC
jgi:ABC-type Zn uptake system ZnuABC Zn-binding protein ZnuA